MNVNVNIWVLCICRYFVVVYFSNKYLLLILWLIKLKYRTCTTDVMMRHLSNLQTKQQTPLKHVLHFRNTFFRWTGRLRFTTNSYDVTFQTDRINKNVLKFYTEYCCLFHTHTHTHTRTLIHFNDTLINIDTFCISVCSTSSYSRISNTHSTLIIP